MGLFDRLASILGLRKKEVNVLVVGLNNSGKSTVINHFKREEERCVDIVPTVGFNVEKFACKFHADIQDIYFKTFDVNVIQASILTFTNYHAPVFTLFSKITYRCIAH